MNPVTTVHVEISAGELMDKITILEIKKRRIHDVDKQRHVCWELDVLCAARDRGITMTPELERYVAELKATNEILWQVEDEIRESERRQEFGAHFIELARAIYHNNDRRSAIKRSINERVGSRIIEEKSYEPYE